MEPHELIGELRAESGPSMVLLVLDGLADIPTAAAGYRTPLEAAATPNLDKIAPESAQGRLVPVAPGITPGSGPGHLGLFGYDPLKTIVGRGVIEALGVDLELAPSDLAARANYATLDESGVIIDRRAGRIPTEQNVELCERLKSIGPIEGVSITIRPGRSHRFVVVWRGADIAGPLTDSDPGKEGYPIREVQPVGDDPRNIKAARVVNTFWKAALEQLGDCRPANGVLLRGISQRPEITPFPERFGVRAAAIASYPMYRGLAHLVGMKKIPTGETPEDLFKTYADIKGDYDFAFIHVKAPDMAGEDGDFDAKVAAFEAVDRALPALLAESPAVLAITGDHATPVSYKSHGWQPVPVLVKAARAGCDGLERFTERTALHGSLGTIPSRDLMAILLASAGRLAKYGA